MGNQTDIGPTARYDLRNERHQQVYQSVPQAVCLILSGNKLNGEGNSYELTILTHITPDRVAFRDALPGPVAVMISADNDQHAIELENDCDPALSPAISDSG